MNEYGKSFLGCMILLAFMLGGYYHHQLVELLTPPVMCTGAAAIGVITWLVITIRDRYKFEKLYDEICDKNFDLQVQLGMANHKYRKNTKIVNHLHREINELRYQLKYEASVYEPGDILSKPIINNNNGKEERESEKH
jgi:hypothetical protein